MEENPQGWLEYERNGNVGAAIALNPHLFLRMCLEIPNVTTRNEVTVLDTGAGTGSLGREFLMHGPEQSRALAFCANHIGAARERVRKFINLDREPAYLEAGKGMVNPPQSVFVQANADEIPLEDDSLDLAVSRQALMHLSPAELGRHFTEISRVLRRGSAYLFTVTDPEYEQAKCGQGRPLEVGKPFKYVHGGPNSGHLLDQFHHGLQGYFSAIGNAHLNLGKVEPVTAVFGGYEKTHPRYYDKSLPMGTLFEVRKPL